MIEGLANEIKIESLCVSETSVFIAGQCMISNPVFKTNLRTWNILKATGLGDFFWIISTVTSHL